jgi:adenylate cyclase
MGVRSKLRTSHLVIVGGILALFLAAGWFDQPRPVVAFLEQKGLDLRFRLRGERPPTGQVVVAGIETRGIEAYGRWPWPRSVFAQLLVRLKDYGAQTAKSQNIWLESPRIVTPKTPLTPRYPARKV